MLFLGGCGAMYNVTVITPEFKYISLVQQHRMVTDVSYFYFIW